MLKHVVITTSLRSYNMWLEVINQYEHYSLLYSPDSKLFIGMCSCNKSDVIKTWNKSYIHSKCCDKIRVLKEGRKEEKRINVSIYI